MDRLEQIKNTVTANGMRGWTDERVGQAMREYATEMVRHNLERAAGQAAIEVESRLSGKTIHGSINSEDPQWVARVNRESIINTEIELI